MVHHKTLSMRKQAVIQTYNIDMNYVYEIYDNYGSVVWVGETIRPNVRLYEHTKKTSGKFYGQNVMMHIVAEFATKQEAFDYQCDLQEEYGLESDRQKSGFNSRNNRDAVVESRKGVNVSSLYGDKIAQTLQKLTYEDAEEIRYKHTYNKTTYVELKRQYGVSLATISNIVNNKTYTK